MTMQGMNAYDRHQKMVHDLVTYYGGQLPQGGQASGHWEDDGLGPHSTQQGPCVQLQSDSGRLLVGALQRKGGGRVGRTK